MSRGLIDPEKEDPFDLFLSSTEVRYCFYHESHRILGSTYGMCVLQDFEAITPNLLARTTETVEGGGLVILLLKEMSSLRQLCSMDMDVHARLRTEAHMDVVPRFNERFLLSLSSCSSCLVVDDELNILPISAKTASLAAVPFEEADENQAPRKELEELQEKLKETQPLGALVNLARTMDQAKAIMTFVDAIAEKTLRTTVSLTASRGRGKSAALGIAMAAAIGFSYSNVFVTSPSPENLKTLFEFVLRGLDALGYQQHTDYDIIQSTNPEFQKAIIRINIFRDHRQTIQYIHPADKEKLGQAELVIVDEAAAIPLPLVKDLLGNYLVFMSSTINGYEGTGRSLSLKLIRKLRETSRGGSFVTGRVLREVELEDPIRYGSNDPVEKWLQELLCLDATTSADIGSRVPHPDECRLYYVNRDTLFSYHRASEAFLHRMVALYVSSHYKNTPNDLQLMSDAPAHHLFVLLGPVDESEGRLPDVLCVIQVCLEGEIAQTSMIQTMSRGARPSGDLIPHTISQQYQDASFGKLSGARVVRIATHPQHQRMGYGTRALDLLRMYYDGEIATTVDTEEPKVSAVDVLMDEETSIRTEVIAPRKDLPPLFLKLEERRPERLHYLGVSYGLTESLFSFWARSGYVPLYIRQTPNDLTGEHTCISLRCLSAEEEKGNEWIVPFAEDFRRRIVSLLGYSFRTFQASLGLAIIRRCSSSIGSSKMVLSRDEVDSTFSPYDLKRLEAYSKGLADYHVIVDMLPQIARLFFLDRFPVSMSLAQCAILLGIGLQHRTIESIEAELRLTSGQVLAMFNKSMRKISRFFRELKEKEHEENVVSSLSMPGKEKDGSEIEQYSIRNEEKDWEDALPSSGKVVPSTISVKRLEDASSPLSSATVSHRKRDRPDEKEIATPTSHKKSKKKKKKKHSM
eukprot:TRINITY_DN10345_c2_g1_i1.p1 TRINITY_DN10345_c2_g1~~TRINITY_DN10345_c2_g1_i1.p1  ORF type:complete len:916 (-),score=243.44 TRINITY_DN10345_c2_g1_i1:253-3000(-)